MHILLTRSSSNVLVWQKTTHFNTNCGRQSLQWTDTTCDQQIFVNLWHCGAVNIIFIVIWKEESDFMITS